MKQRKNKACALLARGAGRKFRKCRQPIHTPTPPKFARLLAERNFADAYDVLLAVWEAAPREEEAAVYRTMLDDLFTAMDGIEIVYEPIDPSLDLWLARAAWG